MKRRRGHDRLRPESLRLPLIALIDVVLFLLMYFLLAGSLAEEERELATTIQLPGAGGGDPFSLDPQIIEVQLEGGNPVYRMGGQAMHDRASLRDNLKALPREPGVIIRVAADVPIAAAATAIQVARDVGFEKITFVPAEK
jgi:biopolymer transport protein ExbD